MPFAVALAVPLASAFAAFAIGLTCAALLAFVRSERASGAVVAAGAAAAWFAPGAPTLVLVWDDVLRVGWCALLAWCAAYARRELTLAVLAFTGLAAVLTGSHVALALVAAGCGAMAATQRVGGRGRATRALAGVVVAHALLRLDWSDPHGASAAMGAVVTVLLTVSAVRRMQPRRRRATVRALGLAGGALGALAVVGLLAGLAANAEMRQGSAVASRALGAARAGDVSAAAPHFSSALRHFTAAQGHLDGPAGRAGRLAPVVGVHLRAGSEVAVSGRSLARAGTGLARSFETDDLAVRSGRLEPLVAQRLASHLERSLPVMAAASARLESADSPWLVPPVADRLSRETARLRRMHTEGTVAAAATRELPGLLGAGGERRYFLAVFTPSEARGLGGFLGNYGEVVAADGRMHLDRIGRTHELNQAARASGATLDAASFDYTARYAKYAPEITWQNVSMSPDFPTVAEVIRRQYPSSGGRDVEGVIAIDPIGLASLLKLTGPVTVAPWPEPLTAANAERVLLHEQYLRLDGAPRVTFLGDVARAVTERLLATDVEPRRLIAAVGPAVAGHHIMVNSAVPSEQRFLERAGVAGRMQRADAADFLAITNQNAGGNKIDWFLHRSYRYAATVGDGGRVSATLDLSLENGAPSSGLPAEVIGNVSTPGDPLGTNRTFVSVYTPLLARTATLDGQPVLFDSERELGLNVYTFYVPVPASASSRVRLELDGAIAGMTAGNYRVQLHRPALAAADDVTVAVGGRVTAHRLDRSRIFGLAAR